ncbi:flavin reductase family protein [Patescibacteria group bacterium]|nr:flavin reductase family protein [Patescibacteria group bacterium]
MRKLWNRPSVPVWSLVTRDTDGNINMNICTYVTSISLQPKLMLIALYAGTKTLKNVLETKQGLLQLLTEELAPVVRVCGRTTGHTTDKIARLKKRYLLSEVDGFLYFTQAAGYVTLSFKDVISTEGDHILAIAEVIHTKNLNDLPLLTTDYLKKHKFVR